MMGLVYMDRRRLRRMVLITLGVGYAMWRITVLYGRPPGVSQSARRLLDERLARGDIDLADYRQVRDALDGAPLDSVGLSARGGTQIGGGRGDADGDRAARDGADPDQAGGEHGGRVGPSGRVG